MTIVNGVVTIKLAYDTVEIQSLDLNIPTVATGVV